MSKVNDIKVELFDLELKMGQLNQIKNQKIQELQQAIIEEQAEVEKVIEPVKKKK